MAVLVWKHGRSKEDVVAQLRVALTQLGAERWVSWNGARVEARYGPFATVLHARGEVTDDSLVLERCSGALAAMLLARCRELFGRLFPEGEDAGVRVGQQRVVSEQEQIRAEYLEIGAHRQADPIERAALESRRAALRRRCTHPNLGEGMLPGDFNRPVAPNQCPDCGFVAEEG